MKRVWVNSETGEVYDAMPDFGTCVLGCAGPEDFFVSPEAAERIVIRAAATETNSKD